MRSKLLAGVSGGLPGILGSFSTRSPVTCVKVTVAAGAKLGPDWPKNFSTFGAELRRVALSVACTGSP
jgi:hypothetical protein